MPGSSGLLNDLPIGIVENALMHTDAEPPFDLETKFKMVRDTGIFDYIDIDPPADLMQTYRALSAAYAVPIRACGYIYQVGRDEAMLECHLHVAASLGAKVLNVQMLRHHACGHVASNEEFAEAYAHAADAGARLGCLPCFEAHVDMWSEDFKRVEQVADLVEAGGWPFRMTLNPSHMIFKIDNAAEQSVLGLGEDLEQGSLVLDPTKPGNVMSRWIGRNLVWHAHARAAVPNNPRTSRPAIRMEGSAAASNTRSSSRARASTMHNGTKRSWTHGRRRCACCCGTTRAGWRALSGRSPSSSFRSRTMAPAGDIRSSTMPWRAGIG